MIKPKLIHCDSCGRRHWGYMEADAMQKVANIVDGWSWLGEGRGEYEWDDPRYDEEVRQFVNELNEACDVTRWEPYQTTLNRAWSETRRADALELQLETSIKIAANTIKCVEAENKRLRAALADANMLTARREMGIARLREWIEDQLLQPWTNGDMACHECDSTGNPPPHEPWCILAHPDPAATEPASEVGA